MDYYTRSYLIFTRERVLGVVQRRSLESGLGRVYTYSPVAAGAIGPFRQTVRGFQRYIDLLGTTRALGGHFFLGLGLLVFLHGHNGASDQKPGNQNPVRNNDKYRYSRPQPANPQGLQRPIHAICRIIGGQIQSAGGVVVLIVANSNCMLYLSRHNVLLFLLRLRLF